MHTCGIYYFCECIVLFIYAQVKYIIYLYKCPVPAYLCRLRYTFTHIRTQRERGDSRNPRTHTHTCIHAYMHTCMLHAYININTLKNEYIIHTCISMHMYKRAYIRTHIRTYLYTYAHTYIHEYIHAKMHACIHTYIITYIDTIIQTYIHT